MVRVISRSENNPVRPAGSVSSVECVSMYCVKDLQCEGSELCFEELRARRYFTKRRQQEEQRRLAEEQRRLWEEEEEVRKMKQLLEDLERNVTLDPEEQRVDPEPVWSSRPQTAAGHAGTETIRPCRKSLGQTDGSESGSLILIPEAENRDPVVCDQGDADENTSCGVFNHSHVTPNSSLGFVQATPSRVLPSPTVNTREALGVIMDMFQAPTLLQESMFNSIIQPEDSFERNCRISSAASSVKAVSATPFMIYRDEQENGGSDPARSRPAVTRALTEISVSKPNEAPVGAESLPDESTIWGSRSVSVGPCPNHTRDFSRSAHMVSTPLHTHAPHSWGIEEAHEETAASASEETPYLRQPTKLSPILEQSPAEEKLPESSLQTQGSIMGEGVEQPSLSQNISSINIRHPQGILSFPDHTALRLQDGSISSRPSWTIYQSPDKDQSPVQNQSPEKPPTAPGPDPAHAVLQPNPLEMQDELMSPKAGPALNWFQMDGSAQSAEPDLDVMMSPAPVATRPAWTIYQSPQEAAEADLLWPTSPEPEPDLLLPERSFQLRRSCGPALSLHEPELMSPQSSRSPQRASEPGLELMASPPQSSRIPQRASEPGLEPMASPPQSSRSPQWTSEPGLEPMASPPQSSRSHQWTSEPGLELMASPPQSSRSLQRASEPGLEPMASPPQSSRSHQWTSEPGLEPMASPPQSSRIPSAPSSPMDTSRPVCVNLVPDPWDEELIASLLSGLEPPLSAHPNLTIWSCGLPTITPKMTVQIPGESLRVDFVLGRGAFATVYQATNLTTSQKLCLKVQKPANPWEFYMASQLKARLQPSVLHLFSSISSAHLFTNGSVLIGDLYNCGTLLSAINLYKSRSEKLMPQPLVLYFSILILHMVEQLHQAHIIHADIKPDNFLLGERFLENDCFDPDHLDHGLALIDLGQSIDMTLFPECTAFTARCMTSGFQCVEMLSGRPWSYQTDYFGIAGTVYCMLFGTYMTVKEEGGIWRTNGVFKRNVHAELWLDFFQSLLNVPDSGVDLGRLRLRLSSVLQQNYRGKLRSLKNRLVVQILEARSARRGAV
ncbi:mitotic checkpoint serine/threonine-protein kinase BUB1-like isoform X1 [Pseudorasbora parva]|uniref:mitotic checkpoint serine/threonine-protein kinase BUB1-like isoform X1 n=1 Tax=Pseudorasbora parva TaxID=51549 RepID=UPI00351F31E5